MADTEVEFELGFVDKRRNNKGQEVGTSGRHIGAAINNTTATEFANVAGLRALLQALDAAYFTNANLNKMTKNDLLYAARVRRESGIANNGSI